MESKYEIHESIDMKKIKEESADYQQSQIKIKNLDESLNGVYQECVTDDICSSEDYSDKKYLSHSHMSCEKECDEVTDMKRHVMVKHKGDFKHSLYKKDHPSNSVSHMKKRKFRTNEEHNQKKFKIKNCDYEGTSFPCTNNQDNFKDIKHTKTYKGEHFDHENDQVTDSKIHVNCCLDTKEYFSPESKPKIVKPRISSVYKKEYMHDCEYCDYKSPQKSNVKRHIKSVHKREKIHKCQYCDFRSSQMASLKTHINSVHTRQKIHRCQYCDYGSPQMSNLRIHINSIHTRQKIHKCQYCDYGSPQMANLKLHINSKHTREKIHKCQYCEYESPHMTNLKHHINSKHTRGKIHKCQYCDYGSSRMSTLRDHINSIHTREKIHKCENCNYETPLMSTLKRHINYIHTREKIHKCQYCEYGSPKMSSLKTHIKSKHKREV